MNLEKKAFTLADVGAISGVAEGRERDILLVKLSDAKQYAEEMCKKQRDICADELDEYVSYADNWNNVTHAPLATEEKWTTKN